MEPLVFITENAEKLAKKNGLMSHLEKLKDQIEKTDVDDLGIAILERRHPYLRKRLDPFRIIAKRIDVDEIPVIVFLNIFRKDSKDADMFDDEREEYGRRYLEPLINLQEIQDFVEKNRQHKSITPTREPLPESLRIWLEPFKREGKGEILILESRQWDEKFKHERFKATIHRYYDILVGICQTAQPGSSISAEIPIYISSSPQGHTIYFTKLGLEGSEHNYEEILFLLDAVEIRNKKSDENVFQQFSWLSEFSNGTIESIDKIARYAERSYFAFILADEFLWKKVEESDAANPALSAEELAILASVRHNAGQEAVLPLFINGRAGSGKSTMLYHLFADYIHRKARTGANGEMIFLTYTDRLLKEALKSVQQLLNVGARFASEELPKDIVEKSERYFWSFLDFLKQMIPDEIRVNKFNESHFVDFGRFKLLYPELSYESTRLPADVAWHVIRTYIKGYKSHDFLTPDDYEDLPNKEKSIPKDIYEEVYTKVWKKYKDSNYWDTQDLVRYILQNDLAKPEYAVVFCDEAQDFTRIELDLILSLLIFRQYDLGWERNLRLPFTMAGDPFQTLNPTGFRWEAIKAAFYDEIVSNLDSENRKTVGLNYQELTYNYRSTVPIVKFSNLLQFWRKYYFNAHGISPQKPWRDEHIIPPRLYILGDTISEEKFMEEVENSVIIIPCEYGQEKRYVENDPLLRKMNELSSPPVFLSPMQAKGLEFPRVILYGFGRDCPDNFFEKTASVDVKLQNEYYLNKLYVGVTRATHYLVIVDTPDGRKKLWEKAVNYQEHYIEDVPGEWINFMGGVTSGEYYSEIDERREDPLEIARRLEQGSTPDLQKQAASFYRRAGEICRAQICEARAMEMEGEFLRAGKQYEEVARLKEAEQCYWKGSCWKQLIQLYTKFDNSDPLIKTTAELMIGPSEKKLQVFIHTLREKLKSSTFILDEIPVQSALQIVVDFLKKHPVASVYERVSSLLKEYPSITTIIGLKAAAHIFYSANQYIDSVRLWEQYSSSSRPQEYYLAKAEITNNPNEKIDWYKKAGMSDKIIAIAESVDPENLNQVSARYVGKAYLERRQPEKAIEYYWQHGLYEEATNAFESVSKELKDADDFALKYFTKLLSLTDSFSKKPVYLLALRWYQTVRKSLSPDQAFNYARFYINTLVEKEMWKEALNAVDNFRLKQPYDIQIRGILLLGIATSKDVKDETVEIRQELTAFVQKYFSPEQLNLWRDIVELKVVGSAIEKVGKDIDALRFYEEMLEKHPGASQDFARQRWAKVKERQIRRQQQDLEQNKRGQVGLRENLKFRNKELSKKLKEWGIDQSILNILPEYPEISVEKDEEKKIQLSARWQVPWCQIIDESKISELTVTINVLNGTIVPFPQDAVLITNNDDGSISFLIYDWDLEGILQPGKDLRLKINNKPWKNFEIE